MTRKELFLKYPPKEFGLVEAKPDYIIDPDCRRRWDNDMGTYLPMLCKCPEVLEGKAFHNDTQIIFQGWIMDMPHQCDEWVIGNVQDAEKLVKNIQDAIQYIKSFPHE